MKEATEKILVRAPRNTKESFWVKDTNPYYGWYQNGTKFWLVVKKVKIDEEAKKDV